jgi:hypothetical protein
VPDPLGVHISKTRLRGGEIDVAVVYPGLFLVHPLTNNPKLGTALCAAYNRSTLRQCDERVQSLDTFRTRQYDPAHGFSWYRDVTGKGW